MEIPSPLKVHGLDLSYFTGKLEGYLRGKGLAYELIEMDTGDFKRCGRATGVAQMPQVEWHNGQWLSDTTLIIEFLENTVKDTSVTPDAPLMRWYAQLLEDFGDEWLWRPALYYRWAHAKDARLMSHRLAEGMMRDVPLPFFMRRWAILNRQRLHFLLLDGYSPKTAPRIEAHYLETLDALEHVLKTQPFVLGSRPTLADYGFFGSMFRHFFCDPTPAGIMRTRAPHVHEWVARLWNCSLSDYSMNPMPHTLPNAMAPLMRIIETDFLPYMQANEQAWIQSERRFKFNSGGVDFKIPVQPYRAWRFQRLRKRFQELAPTDREQIADQCPELAQGLSAPVLKEVPSAIQALPIQPVRTSHFLSRKW